MIPSVNEIFLRDADVSSLAYVLVLQRRNPAPSGLPPASHVGCQRPTRVYH
jgi:hypothetical protein